MKRIWISLLLWRVPARSQYFPYNMCVVNRAILELGETHVWISARSRRVGIYVLLGMKMNVNVNTPLFPKMQNHVPNFGISVDICLTSVGPFLGNP